MVDSSLQTKSNTIEVKPFRVRALNDALNRLGEGYTRTVQKPDGTEEAVHLLYEFKPKLQYALAKNKRLCERYLEACNATKNAIVRRYTKNGENKIDPKNKEDLDKCAKEVMDNVEEVDHPFEYWPIDIRELLSDGPIPTPVLSAIMLIEGDPAPSKVTPIHPKGNRAERRASDDEA